MVGFVFGSDSIMADGPEMFGFEWESDCCSAADAGDGSCNGRIYVGTWLVLCW